MTIWLKQRLAMWMGTSILGGALLWNVGASRAQTEGNPSMLFANEPRLKLTREQATEAFAQNQYIVLGRESIKEGQAQIILSAISFKSRRVFGDRSRLEDAIAGQWIKRKRPFVLIEENGFWGVDLIDTYAQWNNLQGVAKAEAIFKLTGVALDDLPQTQSVRRDICQTNSRKIALGIGLYKQDYDEKYPLAKSWTDNVQPYLKNELLYNCPALPKEQRYGYAYNSKLSNKMERQVFQPAKTICIYETSMLKRNAFGLGENLAFRHQNGANYAFTDGHVKWFPKTQIPSFKLKP